MSVLIAPVPPPRPVREPAIVSALRRQAGCGASDAVLIRIAGSAAEYRRLAKDFGLPAVAANLPVSGPQPSAPARALAPPPSPPAIAGNPAAAGRVDTRADAGDGISAETEEPVGAPGPQEAADDQGGACRHPAAPTEEEAAGRHGGAAARHRPPRARTRGDRTAAVVSVVTALVCPAPARRRTGGHAGADWLMVEIVGDHASGKLILREVGKFWPGFWLAERDQVRLTGPEFEVQP